MNIYVVDDDSDLRQSLAILLRQYGYLVQMFATAQAFLTVAEDLSPGCLLLDIQMPGLDGLALQDALCDMRSPHQVIVLTAYGEIPKAVRAMRAGAIDFLGKPHRTEELLEAIVRAQENQSQFGEREAIGQKLGQLTPKERAVLTASTGGESSKQVAFDLGVSVRTVEMHRSNIIRKLAVKNFAGALLLAAADHH